VVANFPCFEEHSRGHYLVAAHPSFYQQMAFPPPALLRVSRSGCVGVIPPHPAHCFFLTLNGFSPSALARLFSRTFTISRSRVPPSYNSGYCSLFFLFSAEGFMRAPPPRHDGTRPDGGQWAVFSCAAISCQRASLNYCAGASEDYSFFPLSGGRAPFPEEFSLKRETDGDATPFFFSSEELFFEVRRRICCLGTFSFPNPSTVYPFLRAIFPPQTSNGWPPQRLLRPPEDHSSSQGDRPRPFGAQHEQILFFRGAGQMPLEKCPFFRGTMRERLFTIYATPFDRNTVSLPFLRPLLYQQNIPPFPQNSKALPPPSIAPVPPLTS